MKYLLLGLIKTYQMMPLQSHKNCKHIPTCSNYSIEAIRTFGAFKGTLLSIKRICKCNPLSKGGYDPVKENYEKI